MIAGMSYYDLLWNFLIYSFFGWCLEVMFHALSMHKVINRGFLNGPVCPVYGFGLIAVFGAVNTISERFFDGGEISLFALFLVGMALTTSVELIGGWGLFHFFHARWWDYSNRVLNFHGYICLSFSIIWGLAVVGTVRIAHPFIQSHSYRLIPERVGWWILLACYTAYIADTIVTVLFMLKLNERVTELEDVRRNMRIVSDALSKAIGEGSMKAEEMIPTADELKASAAEFGDAARERAAATAEVISALPKQAADKVSTAAEKVASAASETAGKVVSAASETAGRVVSAASETAGRVASAASETAGRVASAASETAGKVASAASETAGRVASAASEAAGRFASAAHLSRPLTDTSVSELTARLKCLEEDSARLREKTMAKHPVMRRIVHADPHMKSTRDEASLDYLRDYQKEKTG